MEHIEEQAEVKSEFAFYKKDDLDKAYMEGRSHERIDIKDEVSKILTSNIDSESALREIKTLLDK